MPSFETMTCRDCGTAVQPKAERVDSVLKVNKYADCYYHCPTCRAGYSNCSVPAKRTKIYPGPELNVPDEVRDGLAAVLRRCLNEGNRANKREKFAFETSEDALTWVMFRYLHLTGKIGCALGVEHLHVESLLFWGCPWPISTDDWIRNELFNLLREEVREETGWLTEPDVILWGSRKLIFVEVKYLASNDHKPGTAKFDLYLAHAEDLFAHPQEEVKSRGYYELTRNWIVGNLLAARLGAEFMLVNLGGERCARSATEFADLLPTGLKGFSFVSWASLLSRLDRPLEGWLSEYLATKNLGQESCR